MATTTKQVRLLVDAENNAETWWDEARANVDRFPAATRPLIERGREVVVAADVADAFWAVAESLDGFADGSTFAPTAIVRQDVEE